MGEAVENGMTLRDRCSHLRGYIGLMKPGPDRSALITAVRTAERALQESQSTRNAALEEAAKIAEREEIKNAQKRPSSIDDVALYNLMTAKMFTAQIIAAAIRAAKTEGG